MIPPFSMPGMGGMPPGMMPGMMPPGMNPMLNPAVFAQFNVVAQHVAVLINSGQIDSKDLSNFVVEEYIEGDQIGFTVKWKAKDPIDLAKLEGPKALPSTNA